MIKIITNSFNINNKHTINIYDFLRCSNTTTLQTISNQMFNKLKLRNDLLVF
jgi:hypothetical protein